MIGSGAHRRLALALAVALGAVASPNVGCEDAYEPPCRVTRDESIVDDVGIVLGPSLARLGEEAVATWPRFERADAGAVTPVGPVAFVAVILDANGRMRFQSTVRTPERLRTRLGGVQSAGLVVEDGAFLVHWVETSVTTEPSGMRRADAALHAAYARDDATGDVPTLACERCTMAVSATSLGAESLVLVRIDESRPGGPPPPPSFAVLRLRRDGSVVRETVPWLGSLAQSVDGGVSGLASATSAPVIRLDERGRVVIVVDTLAWLADDRLQLLAGPIVLPAAPDVSVSWSPTGEASVVYSASPFEEGRSPEQNVASDVFLGLVPKGASTITRRERASSGSRVLAMDRRDEEVGALFFTRGGFAFVALDPFGRKRGGDLFVRGESGVVLGPTQQRTIVQANLLLARGAGRFHAVALGPDALRVTELSCAP